MATDFCMFFCFLTTTICFAVISDTRVLPGFAVCLPDSHLVFQFVSFSLVLYSASAPNTYLTHSPYAYKVLLTLSILEFNILDKFQHLFPFIFRQNTQH